MQIHSLSNRPTHQTAKPYHTRTGAVPHAILTQKPCHIRSCWKPNSVNCHKYPVQAAVRGSLVVRWPDSAATQPHGMIHILNYFGLHIGMGHRGGNTRDPKLTVRFHLTLAPSAPEGRSVPGGVQGHHGGGACVWRLDAPWANEQPLFESVTAKLGGGGMQLVGPHS